MKIDLKGKKVLVTGGSRGIGAAISEALIAAGGQVAVHYQRTAERARELVAGNVNGSAIFCANLAEPAACDQLMDEVLDAFGHLDVLVNNAGIAVMSPLEEPVADWLEKWESTQAVNLRAPALLSRRAILHFQSRKSGGRIIHISSRAAFRGDKVEYLGYAASKAGLVALHRSIARGCGKSNIKSFLLAPGFVRTDMAQEFIDTYGEAYVKDDLALNELTEPQHLAPTVALLASGLADHATGATIDINAGSYVH